MAAQLSQVLGRGLGGVLRPAGVSAIARWSRSVATSARLLSSEETLERAKERLKVLKTDPGNQMKLRLYGLYKQVGAECWEGWGGGRGGKLPESVF